MKSYRQLNFFILWNINLDSVKSYVYYTHSSHPHSFSAAFPVLLQLSKALMIVHCNTKHFPLQLSAHIFCCLRFSAIAVLFQTASESIISRHFYTATKSKKPAFFYLAPVCYNHEKCTP